MTDPAPGGAAPEPVAERWTYGSIRVGKDGRKWHAWVDPAGEEHWFARTGGRMAAGSCYTAWVTRRDGGGVSLHGTPECAGSQAGRETRAALWTAHTLAQTRIESLRAERDGTSPAGDDGQPGEADELTAWAAGLGLEAGDLDDLVHDAYSRQASEVNNGGLGSQVRLLAGTYGTGGARSLLSDPRPAAARRASAGATAARAAGAEQRPPSAPGQ